MAGFMKNAMSYLGMSDVVDDEDDYIEEDEERKPAPKSHSIPTIRSRRWRQPPRLPHRRLPSRSPVAV